MTSRPLKIMLVGDYRYSMYEDAFQKGFEAAGAEVVPFKIDPYFANSSVARIEKRAFWGPAIGKLNRDLFDEFYRHDPDAVFFFFPIFIKPQTVAAMKRHRANVPFAAYNHDNPFVDRRRHTMFRWYEKVMKLADVNYFVRESTRQYAEDLGARRCRIMLQYYAEEIHQPISPTRDEFAVDMIFIGHFEPDGRLAYMRRLQEGGVDLHVYGSGWRDVVERGWLANSRDRRLVDREYSEAISGAKLGLSFVSEKNEDVQTTRNFEIPACGTAMLAPRTPELLRLFREDVDAIFFSSAEELLEKSRRYLADDSAREKIARNGLARVKGVHSNHARAKQAYDDFNALLRNGMND
jgi:spore maturation protein CgeB